jgi:hypothetical protein
MSIEDHNVPAPRVVRPGPDPERDARVAKRRAEDARRAGRALDALLQGSDDQHDLRNAYNAGWRDGYEASETHHNRDYGVCPCRECGPGDHDPRCACSLAHRTAEICYCDGAGRHIRGENCA